ncbi:MAG: UDP-3-O-(3-hydroxymyristoyl)glucosamine N-acyltransferase [Candidatus Puniceispirillum sp.]
MGIDRDFYHFASGIDAAQLGAAIGANEITGPSDLVVTDIASFDGLGPAMLGYQGDADAARQARVTSAVIITTAAGAAVFDKSNSCLVVDSPRIGFARAAAIVAKPREDSLQTTGISPTAIIAAGAKIHPAATIMAGARIGADSVVEAGAVIGPSVRVGARCRIGANAVLSFALLGDDVDIGAGSVIGEAGFGFEMTVGGAIKVPHLGLVVIGDQVAVGSNCAIDRGSLGNTQIGPQVMIDNLCHIAHNVVIGANAIVAGQIGLSGSVHVGERVMMGGQVGVAPHLKIGDGAVLMARSGVTKDVAPGEQVAGFPGVPARQFWRDQAAVRRLAKSAKKGRQD